MNRFWHPVLRPVLEAAEAKRIVEIGAAEGRNTIRLARWCARRGAHLDVIDPAPAFDVTAFAMDFAGHAEVHITRSLDVLARLLPVDVVLIDGDHNWYTVFHELTALYGPPGSEPAADGPVAICHDVGWPFARRDAYYDPQSIPAEYRQPHGSGIPVPGEKALVPGPVFVGWWAALAEGGPRNGVRTAIEDAVKGREDRFRIVTLDILEGLALIAPAGRLTAAPALRSLFGELELSGPWKQLVRLLDQNRLGLEARLAGLTGKAE